MIHLKNLNFLTILNKFSAYEGIYPRQIDNFEVSFGTEPHATHFLLKNGSGPCLLNFKTYIFNSSKLHDNIIWFFLVNNLEIFNRCLGHPSVKIEHIALRVLIPDRRFVL